jgi:ATP phosphoribosyltransferase regulatory subunit HisZ
MTVPIARLVATRYPTADPPLRLCYIAHAYRAVRPHRGQMREFLQAGIELIGAPGAKGTAEALTVLCGALDAVGLTGYRVGLGDAALYPNLMAAFDVPDEARERMLGELGRKDLVGLEREIEQLGLPDDAAAMLVRVPQLRGGADVLGAESGPVADAVRNLRSVLDLLEPNVADRVIFDLGLARGLGYYSGAVFDVYDPALGAPLGGGGRYDRLLGRYGRDLPAVGFAIGVDRLHAALSGEEHAGL